ncbi:MAG: hypothetical protein ACRDPH_08025, partial [Marmoricola sp.]
LRARLPTRLGARLRAVPMPRQDAVRLVPRLVALAALVPIGLMPRLHTRLVARLALVPIRLMPRLHTRLLTMGLTRNAVGRLRAQLPWHHCLATEAGDTRHHYLSAQDTARRIELSTELDPGALPLRADARCGLPRNQALLRRTGDGVLGDDRADSGHRHRHER